jgi:hypothetical protein
MSIDDAMRVAAAHQYGLTGAQLKALTGFAYEELQQATLRPWPAEYVKLVHGEEASCRNHDIA